MRRATARLVSEHAYPVAASSSSRAAAASASSTVVVDEEGARLYKDPGDLAKHPHYEVHVKAQSTPVKFTNMSKFEVGQALNVLAKHRQTHTESWNACLKRARELVGGADHHEAALVMNACVRAPPKVRDLAKEVFECYAQQVPRVLKLTSRKKVTSNDLAIMANALGKAGYRDEELMSAMSAALSRNIAKRHRGDRLNSHMVANIANAYAKLDIRDAPLFNHVLRDAVLFRVRMFQKKDLLQVCNAYAKLAFRDTELFDKLADRIEDQIRYLDGRCVSVIAHAYARLSLGRSLQLFDVLGKRVGQVAASCNDQAVASIITSFARIGFGAGPTVHLSPREKDGGEDQRALPDPAPARRWGNVFDSMAAQLPRVLSFAKIQAITRIAQGLAKVGYLAENDATRQVLASEIIDRLKKKDARRDNRWCGQSLAMLSAALPDITRDLQPADKAEAVWRHFGVQVEEHANQMTASQISSITLACGTAGQLNPTHALIAAVRSSLNADKDEDTEAWTAQPILAVCRALHVAREQLVVVENESGAQQPHENVRWLASVLLLRVLEVSWEIESLVPRQAVQAGLDLLFVVDAFLSSSDNSSSPETEEHEDAANIVHLKNCLRSLTERLQPAIDTLAENANTESATSQDDGETPALEYERGRRGRRNVLPKEKPQEKAFVCLDDQEDSDDDAGDCLASDESSVVEEPSSTPDQFIADFNALREKLGAVV